MKQNIDIKIIQTNHGQIDGVPGNPRRVSVGGLTRMIDSIREDPDFLDIRPLAVIRRGKSYVCLGGNTRLKAARRIGLKEVPCVVIPEETSIEKLKRFVIKDNGHYGEWEADMLVSDWDTADLQDWGVDFDLESEPKHKTHAPGWKSNTKNTKTHYTTLGLDPTIHKNANHWYIALYKITKTGYPLDDVKNEVHVPRFAEDACTILTGLLNHKIKNACVITTPRRRHKDFHFATEVCKDIAERMGWDVQEDAFSAKDKQRLNPIFEYHAADMQTDAIVLFDDIVTTGSTLRECHKHLPKGKTVITIVGVYNREDYESKEDGT